MTPHWSVVRASWVRLSRLDRARLEAAPRGAVVVPPYSRYKKKIPTGAAARNSNTIDIITDHPHINHYLRRQPPFTALQNATPQRPHLPPAKRRTTASSHDHTCHFLHRHSTHPTSMAPLPPLVATVLQEFVQRIMTTNQSPPTNTHHHHNNVIYALIVRGLRSY